jgi:hypothetical protein
MERSHCATCGNAKPTRVTALVLGYQSAAGVMGCGGDVQKETGSRTRVVALQPFGVSREF